MSSPQQSSSPRSEGRRSIEDLVETALRGALLARGDRGAAGPELRRAMSALTDEVRRLGLPTSQLVVTLREAWAGLAEASAIAPASRRAEVASHVVGLCIDEYYALLRDDPSLVPRS